MRIFGYLEADSFIHRLDPRTKTIGLFIVSGSLFAFNHPLYVFTLFCFTLILSAIAKISRRILRLIIPLLLIALVSTIAWPFYLQSGTPLFTIGGFTLTNESLYYGIAMGLRWAGAIVIGMIFLSTMKADDFYAAMVLMKLPYSFAFVISLTYRLVPTFIGIGVEIKEAQISRGLDLSSGNILSRLYKWMVLAIPLFMNAIHQTNRMTISLESRAFGSKIVRTFYRQYKMKIQDLAVLIFTSLFLLLCIVLRSNGFGVILHDRL